MTTAAPSVPPAALAELAQTLSVERAALAQSIPQIGHPAPVERCGQALGRRNALLLDHVLTSLYAAKIQAPDATAIALAGVGSYGRGAVALHSDLDVRLLTHDVAAAAETAEALLYPLWDLGVTIGHQVVTVGDLVDAARDDLPTATSLLDWRHVAGDRALSDAMVQRAAGGLFASSELPRFMHRLEEEVAQRHARFGGSVYLLEPDVKNGPGGLRDLDIARWAAQARYGVAELDALVRVGALLPREAHEVGEALEVLWRIRNLLHADAGRRSDRLTFDEQETIAERLGHGKGGEAVERLMSQYYRSARTISRARDVVLSRATPHLRRRKPHEEDLGRGVRIFDGSVTLGDSRDLATDPALSVRVVAAAVDRGLPLLPYARDAIIRASGDPAWCAELRAKDEASQLFLDLVSRVRETRLRAGSVLRELHDLGLLIAMIPEFSPVVGRVHHDVYHVYTVDVHSVAAVDRLCALVRGDLAADFPLASRLAAEVPRPRMLFFATLLHDVGKAIGGRDHSQRGAEMASEIFARLGLSSKDIDDACHLIRKHLLMYHVATKRDLDDPVAIAEFVSEVRGRQGLRDLYLLTVSDLSTTSPTSMTSWKARMLDELYLMADASLRGTAGAGSSVESATEDALRAATELPAASDDERVARGAFLPAYVASMPERYLLANTPLAIAAHAEIARKHGQRARDGAPTPALVSVGLVPSRHPEAAEICVVATDRPGLLAAITAAIAASRLEVHGAQIHSRVVSAPAGIEAKVEPGDAVAEGDKPPSVLADGHVLQAVDLFWVRDRAEGVDGVARALPKLVRDINAVVGGDVAANDLARHRVSSALATRSVPRVRMQVVIDDRASPTHTVIEVTTRDRPGLLFAIADALYRLGLSIAVAKINTEGMRVADVFYVAEADGSKVAAGARSTLVRDRLVEAVGEPEGAALGA